MYHQLVGVVASLYRVGFMVNLFKILVPGKWVLLSLCAPYPSKTFHKRSMRNRRNATNYETLLCPRHLAIRQLPTIVRNGLTVRGSDLQDQTSLGELFQLLGGAVPVPRKHITSYRGILGVKSQHTGIIAIENPCSQYFGQRQKHGIALQHCGSGLLFASLQSGPVWNRLQTLQPSGQTGASDSATISEFSSAFFQKRVSAENQLCKYSGTSKIVTR